MLALDEHVNCMSSTAEFQMLPKMYLSVYVPHNKALRKYLNFDTPKFVTCVFTRLKSYIRLVNLFSSAFT